MWKWQVVDQSLYVGSTQNDLPSDKLAIFDMDGTIIVTKSKKTNPKNANDWEFFDHSVPVRLRKLKSEGFRIIILSNQKGVSLGHVCHSEIQSKIEAWSARVGIEMTALFASKGDHYRKPEIGAWTYIQKVLNPLPIDHNLSVLSRLL